MRAWHARAARSSLLYHGLLYHGLSNAVSDGAFAPILIARGGVRAPNRRAAPLDLPIKAGCHGMARALRDPRRNSHHVAQNFLFTPSGAGR